MVEALSLFSGHFLSIQFFKKKKKTQNNTKILISLKITGSKELSAKKLWGALH